MNKLFENSFLASKFFVGEFSGAIKNSFLLKLLKFKNQNLSLFFAFLAIFSTWYEPILKKAISYSFTDAFPVIFIFVGLFLADFTKLKIYKLHIWYLLFLLLTIISGFSAVFGGRAEINAVLYVVVLAQFLFALLVGQSQNKKKLIDGLFFLGVPLSIYGLWQFFSGRAVYFTSSLENIHARASATFAGPNLFGMFATILFLVSYFEFQKERRIIYLIFSFLFLVAAITSLSRTAWLALFLSTLLFFDFKKLQIANLGIISSIKSRLGTLFNSEYWFNASIDGRIWSLKNGLFILKKNPFLGTGPGTYGGKFAEIYSSPVYFLGMQNGYVALLTTDNQYLAILVQLGIAGFLFFMGFFLALILQIIFFKNQYYKLSLAVLVSFVIMMLTSNTLEFTAISVPVAFLAGMSLKEK